MADEAMDDAGSDALRDELTDSIVSMEWGLFQKVNNAGGRASCQSMPKTFSVMRRAQFSIWTIEMLQSYLSDLDQAVGEGRNPLAEKYGYMEESTHPDEYAAIKDGLPSASEAKSALVEEIVAIQMVWAEEMTRKYPAFSRHGRPLHTSEDGLGTSIETYSRGELKTYSERTLLLMRDHYAAALDAGRNLQEESDLVQVQKLGFVDLDAAEKRAAEKLRARA